MEKKKKKSRLALKSHHHYNYQFIIVITFAFELQFLLQEHCMVAYAGFSVDAINSGDPTFCGWPPFLCGAPIKKILPLFGM